MNDRSWDELVDLIDSKYRIDKSSRKDLQLEDNKELKKTVEEIEFEKDNVKYKIERTTSPAIVDKKTFYHQTGSANRIQYVYDPEETTKKVVFYKQLADGNWNEISPEEMMADS